MEVMSTIRSNMKKFENYSKYIDRDILEETVFIKHSGYGEMALLFALVHPDKKIIAYEENYEKCELAKYAAKDLVNNILFLSKGEPIIVGENTTIIPSSNVSVGFAGGGSDFTTNPAINDGYPIISDFYWTYHN